MNMKKLVKLSPTQAKVMQILSSKPDEWFDAYTLKVSLSTLDSLRKKGLVESRGHGALGSMYSPRTTIEYRVKHETINL